MLFCFKLQENMSGNVPKADAVNADAEQVKSVSISQN
jgi:hypothetical protein